MANFSDFVNNNNTQETKINSENSNKSEDVNKENLENLIDKYSKYNSNDLMGEFLRLTIEKKKRGELKKEELQTIKQTIYPYLNDEQKQNLNSIIDMVDNVK